MQFTTKQAFRLASVLAASISASIETKSMFKLLDLIFEVLVASHATELFGIPMG